MVRLMISLFLGAATLNAACAQSVSGITTRSQVTVDDRRAQGLDPRVQSSTRSLTMSPSSCAPDMADAEWGPGGKLFGYRCIPSPANGG